MSKGVLLFAYNNDQIDYIKLAIFTAQRVKSLLDVPVSLITDSKSVAGRDLSYIFEHIIFYDSTGQQNTKYFNDGLEKSVNLEWNNSTRFAAYELSPYQETLVLDVDYVLNSKNLKNCWNQPHDFLIYKASVDLCHHRKDTEFNYVSDHSIPFYWATVFFFRKTDSVKNFFRLVTHVKENWNFYKILYQIHSTNFRNDFAFSIAIHMMNGFTYGDFAKSLPGKMYYTLDTDILTQFNDSKMTFVVHKSQSTDAYFPMSISNLDVHVMNKYSLLRCIENE